LANIKGLKRYKKQGKVSQIYLNISGYLDSKIMPEIS